jgi:hypothetical protein
MPVQMDTQATGIITKDNLVSATQSRLYHRGDEN